MSGRSCRTEVKACCVTLCCFLCSMILSAQQDTSIESGAPSPPTPSTQSSQEGVPFFLRSSQVLLKNHNVLSYGRADKDFTKKEKKTQTNKSAPRTNFASAIASAILAEVVSMDGGCPLSDRDLSCIPRWLLLGHRPFDRPIGWSSPPPPRLPPNGLR